jgi:N-acetylglucosamine repressor
MKRTGDNGYIKALNYKLVLDAIRTNEPVSRIELSHITGLTRSTCTLITERMLNQKLIKELGKSDSLGGRPRILLELNNEAGVVIGLKLMDDCFSCASIDLRGNILTNSKESVPKHSGPEIYLPLVSQYLQKILALHRKNFPHIPVLGLGVGLGGRVSAKTGELLESSVLGWHNVPIVNILKQTIDLPIFIENDVNTFAIGEKFFGAGKHLDNFLCMSVGEGIGLGIIMNGQLVNGAHHGAGEIGHTIISTDPEAPVCACSRRGCLEAFAADGALVAGYQAKTGELTTPDELLQRAKAKDPQAIQVLQTAGTYLGVAVSTLINLLDPQAIILGGERANASQFILPTLEKAMHEHTVYGLSREVDIIVLQPSNDDWVRGVAALAMREIFSENLEAEV